jgi:SAM-dependent methyltransferase
MIVDYLEIDSCEVCGNNNLKKVIDLGNHPLCDDLVRIGEKRLSKEYPIEILFCSNCYTGLQRFQVPKKDLFPKTYHYRSRFTSDVLTGMSKLVDDCEKQIGTSLNGKKVLDIGCNDGSLLDFFKEKGAQTIGIEPTNAALEAADKGHKIYNDFFDQKLAIKVKAENDSPDIITFTNVFAHIENLNELLDSLKDIISLKTILIIENHYLGSIVKNYQFDTFYHEHPRTYSLKSFTKIAKRLEMNLFKADFPSRYGGNIRVYIGSKLRMIDEEKKALDEIIAVESNFEKSLNDMQKYIGVWQAYMGPRIQKLSEKYGPLAAKAFPGRAAILIKLLNLDKDVLAAVYEKKGSMKIGHYLPGTKITIESDEILFKEFPPVIVNLAWHISSEIRDYLLREGFKGEIIDIYSPNISK